MSWDMSSATKPVIYNYNASKGYWAATPRYFTWQTGNLWANKEECVKFINDTNDVQVIKKIGIQTVACDSGGRGYWAYGGYRGIPCKGYGGTYRCYVRVSNDGQKTFAQSNVVSHDVPNISGSNMNSPGSGPYATAVFGNPPFTGDKVLQYRNFEFTTLPPIQKGGVAYVHLGISNFKGDQNSVTIRFVLNPLAMIIDLTPQTKPYVWQYSAADKAWHLREPLYAKMNGKWQDPNPDVK